MNDIQEVSNRSNTIPEGKIKRFSKKKKVRRVLTKST